MSPQRQHFPASAEQTNKKLRHSRHQDPGPDCIQKHHNRHIPYGLFDPAVLCRSVIVAQNRLPCTGKARNRKSDDLPDRINDRHDSHIDIAAMNLQRGVTHHLHHRVCH